MQERFINLDTGEIQTKKELSSNKPILKVKAYVGMDTKYPAECTNKDSLLESISNMDAYISKAKVKVNYSALLDSVTQGKLTVKESSIVTYLATNICGWNYFIGEIRQLSHLVADTKNLNRMLSTLEDKRMIKVTHKGFYHKDSIVIKVSPYYVWKGDLVFRDEAIYRWYLPEDPLV